MASVADTLITKYELQDNYSGKLKKISGETDKLGKSLDGITGGSSSGTGGSLGGLVSGLGTLGGMAPGIGTAVTLIATAMAAVAAATVGATVAAAKFGMEAMKAAAPMDTIERTFAGVYGSTKKAAEMMAYLKQEAMKSNFEFKSLANAAKLVVMNGMKFSEFKDAMQAIALRGSGDPAQNLETIASTLTRIKAGDFAQAFENLRSFGVGKDTLVKLGATFDKSGQFTGNISDALELFKKIGAESQGVVDSMNGGMEATLSNMEEGFGLMMQQAGKAIFENFKPLIDNIISTITDILDSGVIKDTINAISAIFDVDPGDNGLAKLAIGVLAAIRTGAWIVRSVWEGILGVVRFVQNVLKYIPGFNGIGGVSPAGDLFSAIQGDWQRNYNEMMNTFQASQKVKQKKGNKSSVEPTIAAAKEAAKEATEEAVGKMEEPASPLMQIARNTKQTADNTKASIDMSRHILGGGDIGRLGLSPAELDGLNGRVRRGGSSNRAVKVKIIGGGSFEEVIQNIFNQALPQLKRQGLI
jgi:hypothetical protein